MSAGTRLETKSLDRLLGIAARQSGIGVSVTNKALTSNVATLTTGSAHSFAIGDSVMVKGVDATFDGQFTLTAASGTTLSYAKTASNVASVAVSLIAGVSKRISQGFKRWGDTENFEALAAALTSQAQGYFWAAIKRVSSQGGLRQRNIELAAELVVALPKDTSADLNTAWEMAMALRDDLELPSNFTDGEFPAKASVGLHKILDIETAGILIFDFGAYGGGGLVIADP